MKFRYLSRREQIMHLLRIEKQTKCPIGVLLRQCWNIHRVSISIDEVRQVRNFIPTNGLNTNLPSQISTDVSNAHLFSITENVMERFEGRNSRKGQW
jgi:hypothetical protein